MVASKKTYTNNDIMRELTAQRTDFKTMNTRLTAIEGWKAKMDWTKEAVNEYKRQEAADRQTNVKDGFYKNATEVLKYLAPLLAALTVYLYAKGR